MSEAKYRIPRVAMAVMVLGANGCGQDEGGSKDPETRIQNLGKKVCKLGLRCEDGLWKFDSDRANHDFRSEQECVDTFVSYQQERLRGLSNQCRNAYLSYYECEVSFGCDGDAKDKCNASYWAYYDACAEP